MEPGLKPSDGDGAERGSGRPARIARGRLAVFVAAFFTAVGLANAVQVHLSAALGGQPIGWAKSVLLALPFWWVKAALVPLVFLAARALPPLGRGWWWRAPAHLGCSMLFSATPLVLGGLLVVAVYPELGPARAALGELFSAYFVAGVSIYWLLLAAVHALDFYERYREREVHAARLAQRGAELEARLVTARLAALRMQLNPHFLFNTLNGVSALALRGDGRRVARMLSELAGILRITLDRTDPVVTLDEELDLVDRVLEIERIRFGERLRVRHAVSPAARAARVPSLLLLPVVENAVKHGVGVTPGPVEIEIGARVKDGRTTIWVRDSGPGFDRRTPDGGVGLENTRVRLDALYGNEARLTLSPPGRGAEVRVEIPYAVDEPVSARAVGT